MKKKLVLLLVSIFILIPIPTFAITVAGLDSTTEKQPEIIVSNVIYTGINVAEDDLPGHPVLYTLIPGHLTYPDTLHGFTNVLNASFTGLTAGIHHLNLAIADAGDYVFDSCVFLPIDSFPETKISSKNSNYIIPEPVTITLFGMGLSGLIGYGKRKFDKC